MPDLEVILQHGWALDASMWSAWTLRFRELSSSTSVKIADRGYFAPANHVSFSDGASRKILVVHSLGLHLASRAQFEKANLLVIICGFAHFHGGSERQSKLSKIAVRRMLQKLDLEPCSVIRDFYDNCGFPTGYETGPFEKIKSVIRGDQSNISTACEKNEARCEDSELTARCKTLQLLKDDLELLNNSSVNREWLALPDDVLILHAEQDVIAPPHHADELRLLRPDSRTLLQAQGSHALPYQDAEWCLKQIHEALLVKS